MSKLNPEKLLVASKDKIQLILDQYGISLDHFEPAASGIENLSLIIRSGDDKYVLRVYPQQAKSNDEVRLELDFMAVLRDVGLPIPKVIVGANDDSLVILTIDESDWQCVLMEYAPGAHPTGYNPGLTKDMATIQANMHLIGGQYARSHDLASKLHQLRETQVVDALLSAKDTDSYYQEFLERVQAYRVELVDDLPIGVSHFDYDVDNLFAQNNKVTAILDFGDIACMPLVICLGYTLWDILFEEGGSSDLMFEYLQAYEKVRRLSKAEKDVLGQIILFRHYVITTFSISFGSFTHDRMDRATRKEEYLRNLSVAF